MRSGGETSEVDAGGQIHSIEDYPMLSGGVLLIEKHGHFAACDVIDQEFHSICFGKREGDGCGRVEGIGEDRKAEG